MKESDSNQASFLPSEEPTVFTVEKKQIILELVSLLKDSDRNRQEKRMILKTVKNLLNKQIFIEFIQKYEFSTHDIANLVLIHLQDPNILMQFVRETMKSNVSEGRVQRMLGLFLNYSVEDFNAFWADTQANGRSDRCADLLVMLIPQFQNSFNKNIHLKPFNAEMPLITTFNSNRQVNPTLVPIRKHNMGK